MKKYILVLALTATGLFNLVEARIRENIPATYIENRELVFRHTNLDSKANPLQVQIVVDDTNGNELTINLPVTIGLGGHKATVRMPTVASDTRVSFEVWGGKFKEEDRFKHVMIIFDDPLLDLTPVLDQGEVLITIPNQFSTTPLFGKEGPQGPQGPQGVQGPVGPTPTSIPGSNITSPVQESTMLDNSAQTLGLAGAAGSNVTLMTPTAGAINLTLPSTGTLATLQGPTPIAVDPFAADLEGVNSINAANLNYINITDSNITSADTLQFIYGGVKGQELIIELEEDIFFYADNSMTPDTIQWGRGTSVGANLPGSAHEIFRFLHNGTAWFLIDRFTL